MNPKQAIERVMKLRHWTGSVDGPRHTCKCEDCQAIKQVCALAREGLSKKRPHPVYTAALLKKVVSQISDSDLLRQIAEAEEL